MHEHHISSFMIGFARTLHSDELSPDSPLLHNSGEVESSDATAASQSLQDMQAQKAAAEEKAAAMHDEMLAFRRQVADAEAKSRADRKVRPINSACSCELEAISGLPPGITICASGMPGRLLVFCSAVQCCALLQLRLLWALLAELQPDYSAAASALLCSCSQIRPEWPSFV